MNIIFIGMPGSGKTTLGKIIAKELGFSFYDSDKYIEAKSGKTVAEIFAEYGEAHFRNLEAQAMEELCSLENTVISTGGGVVERPENVDILKKSGTVIFINRPTEEIAANINTAKRPLLKDGKNKLFELYKRRINLYKNACHIEIINSGSIDDAVEKITYEVKKNG